MKKALFLLIGLMLVVSTSWAGRTTGATYGVSTKTVMIELDSIGQGQDYLYKWTPAIPIDEYIFIDDTVNNVTTGDTCASIFFTVTATGVTIEPDSGRRQPEVILKSFFSTSEANMNPASGAPQQKIGRSAWTQAFVYDTSFADTFRIDVDDSVGVDQDASVSNTLTFKNANFQLPKYMFIRATPTWTGFTKSTMYIYVVISGPAYKPLKE